MLKCFITFATGKEEVTKIDIETEEIVEIVTEETVIVEGRSCCFYVNTNNVLSLFIGSGLLTILGYCLFKIIKEINT